MGRRIAKVAGLLALLAIAGLAAFIATYSPKQRPASAETIEATAERLARGRYLVHHVSACLECHSKRQWDRYAGPLDGEPGAGGTCYGPEVGMPGKVCVPNITADKKTGLGGWSDGQILRAIREGVDKDGRGLFPMMPYPSYRAMADDDAHAVVAYLRSLGPVSNQAPETAIDFPVSFFIKMVPKPLDGPVTAPDRGDAVAYGGYLATIAGCKQCHTPVDGKKRPVVGKEFAGGQEFTLPDSGLVRSANITPHATGIGGMSKQSFLALFRAFADPASAAKVDPKDNTPMPWLTYAGMTDDDLSAIYDYLKTVKPQENPVEKRPGTESLKAMPSATASSG